MQLCNSFINSIFEKICSLKLHGDNFRGECGFTFEAMKRSAPSSERRALIGFFTRQDLLKLLELPPFPCHHMCSAVCQARRNIWGQWGFALTYFWQIYWPYSRLSLQHKFVPTWFEYVLPELSASHFHFLTNWKTGLIVMQ